jgi:hypothetical protein
MPKPTISPPSATATDLHGAAQALRQQEKKVTVHRFLAGQAFRGPAGEQYSPTAGGYV